MPTILPWLYVPPSLSLEQTFMGWGLPGEGGPDTEAPVPHIHLKMKTGMYKAPGGETRLHQPTPRTSHANRKLNTQGQPSCHVGIACLITLGAGEGFGQAGDPLLPPSLVSVQPRWVCSHSFSHMHKIVQCRAPGPEFPQLFHPPSPQNSHSQTASLVAADDQILCGCHSRRRGRDSVGSFCAPPNTSMYPIIRPNGPGDPTINIPQR